MGSGSYFGDHAGTPRGSPGDGPRTRSLRTAEGAPPAVRLTRGSELESRVPAAKRLEGLEPSSSREPVGDPRYLVQEASLRVR